MMYRASIFKTVAVAFLLATATRAEAIVINFEDLGVTPGNQLNPPSGIGVVTGGFNYTPGPNNSGGFNDLHIANQQSFWSFNGTTVGGTHDDVVLSKVGGGAFSISAFDFAGFPLNREVPFQVFGVRADATLINQSFIPDGLSDGSGGVVDFQTFSFIGNWTNLVSVTWVHSGAGTETGLFALDNIVVDESAVPEPATLVLGGIGALITSTCVARRRGRQR